MTRWRSAGFAVVLAAAAPLGAAPTPGATPAAVTPAPAPAPAAQPAAPPSPVPVVLAGRTLFKLAGRVGPFTPAERAAAVTRRLEDSLKAPLGPDTFAVTPTESGAEITIGDRILLEVTEADARLAGAPAPVVAGRWVEIIRKALAERRRVFSLRSLLLGAAGALLATAVLVALIKLLARGLALATARIRTWTGRAIPALRIQKLEIVSAGRLAGFAILVLRGARAALVVLALYAYVPLVLGLFPWTQGLSRILLSYLLNAAGSVGTALVAFLPNLFYLLVIAVIAYYAVKALAFLFSALGEGTIALPSFDPEWALPTFKIVRFLVIIFSVIISYPYLPGSSSKAFQGVSIFLGVLFSLGSSSAIANVVAGVILTYTGSFRIGDRVKIADVEGDVIEKTLLVTRIRTIKNVKVTIPNGVVIASHVCNFSALAGKGGLILHTKVTIGYDSPWRVVHELLIKAARQTEGVLQDPAPFVLQLSLDDYYPTYQINAYTDRPARMAMVYSDLHKSIQDVFNEAGVEIMSPAYTSLRDGTPTTIPG